MLESNLGVLAACTPKDLASPLLSIAPTELLVCSRGDMHKDAHGDDMCRGGGRDEGPSLGQRVGKM